MGMSFTKASSLALSGILVFALFAPSSNVLASILEPEVDATLPGAVGPAPYSPKRKSMGSPVATGTKVGADIVYGADDVVYRSIYDKKNRTGNIVVQTLEVEGVKKPIFSHGDAIGVLPDWVGPKGYLAALNAVDNGWEKRHIFSWNPNTKKSVKFDFDSLGTTKLTRRLVNYVRGDSSNERPLGKKWRNRLTGGMGEIGHSNLLYWEHHSALVQGESSVNVKKRLYVGTNGGMLHALDAETGKEVWAYVPSCLFDKLKYLKTDPLTELQDELRKTTAYVDGQITIKEVEDFNGTGTTRTVLVGGLGAGARCVYALDITDPGQIAADLVEDEESGYMKLAQYPQPDPNFYKGRVLWEINADTPGYEKLGYVHGPIEIARVLGSSPNATQAVAIFGNGHQRKIINDTVAVYVVDLATGHLVKQIDTTNSGLTEPGPLVRAGLPVGMTSPTAVYPLIGSAGGDGELDESQQIDELGQGSNNAPSNTDAGFLAANRVHSAMYVGSYHGDLWKIDLTNLDGSRVKTRLMYTAKPTDGDVDPMGLEIEGKRRRSISSGVSVYNLPDGKRRVILFGTGRSLQGGGLGSVFQALQHNAIYGIYDGPSSSGDEWGTPTIDDDELDFRTVYEGINRDPSFSDVIEGVLVGNYMAAKTPLHLATKYTLNKKQGKHLANNGNDRLGADTLPKKGWALQLNRGQGVIGGKPIIRDGMLHIVSNHLGVRGVFAKNWYYTISATRGARLKCPVFDLDGDGKLCSGQNGAYQPDLNDHLLGAKWIEKWSGSDKFAERSAARYTEAGFGDGFPVATRIRTGHWKTVPHIASQPFMVAPTKGKFDPETALTLPLINTHRGRSDLALGWARNHNPEAWQEGDLINGITQRGVRHQVKLVQENGQSRYVVETVFKFPLRGERTVLKVHHYADGRTYSEFRKLAAVRVTQFLVWAGLNAGVKALHFFTDIAARARDAVFLKSFRDQCKGELGNKYKNRPLKKLKYIATCARNKAGPDLREQCRNERGRTSPYPLQLKYADDIYAVIKCTHRKRKEIMQEYAAEQQTEREKNRILEEFDKPSLWAKPGCFSFCSQVNTGGEKETNLLGDEAGDGLRHTPGVAPNLKVVKPISTINLEERF